jgi:transcriptional regulator with XRE-family HTH domain
MGHARRRPKRLAEKLRRIREALELSQADLMARLGVGVRFSEISKYENDKREPPLNVLLAYARLAKIPLAQIVDDEEDLDL